MSQYKAGNTRGVFYFIERDGLPMTAEQVVAALNDAKSTVINTPELLNFIEAIQLEALYQREKFGTAHDEGKEAEDWMWLIAYLATKATQASRYGDIEKYRHHVITCGAACLNWHSHAIGANQELRAGAPIPKAIGAQ